MMPIDEHIEQDTKWITSELTTALGVMLPLLLAHSVIRLDSQVEGVGSITAYWVNDILRIDVKPVQE